MKHDIDELNRKFGIPGKIAFRTGHGGYPEAVLANKYGSAEIAFLGGVVLSYHPTGQLPVIFRPARREYARGDKIHGGIPLCWPQFGKGVFEGMAQHGFAYMMVFDVEGTKCSEESCEITFVLRSDDDTKSLWPHDFELRFTVILSMKLNLELTTINTGKERFHFTDAFHPYFLIRDPAEISVKGVDGCAYWDGNADTTGVWQGDFKIDQHCDHVITLKESPKHEAAILDPGLKRAIAIASANHGVFTIWNPGDPKKFYQMPDQADDDFRHFVCVEPCTGFVKPVVELAPGERHSLVCAIQSVQEQ